jgi:hypothetical protein
MSKDKQSRIPGTDEEQRPTAPSPVNLPARRDWTLVVEGLEKKADATAKLAAKAKDEGYHRAAREMEIDVAAINERILPVLREQREIRFVTHESALVAVTALVHEELARAVNASPRPKLPELEAAVASKVATFAELVYRAAWAHGHAARQDDVDEVLMEAADKARLLAKEEAHGRQPGPGGFTS